MKKIVCLILAMILIMPVFAADNVDLSKCIALYIGSNDALINNETVKIDDNQAIKPFEENGRTFVPVRFIAEALGLTVSFAESAKAVFLKGDGVDIGFGVGDNYMYVNGTNVQIDANDATIIPIEKSDRIFLPLRALCEAVGKQVFYDRGLIIIGENASSLNAETDKTELDGTIQQLNALPVVGDLDNLKKLIGESNGGPYYYRPMEKNALAATGGMAVEDSAAPPTAPQPQASAASASKDDSDYSKTNTQVEGVDEADIVKTDGNYIYQVNNKRIIITSINPAEQMSITSIIKEDAIDFSPIEMYIDGDKLTVISNVSRNMPQTYDSANDVAPTTGGVASKRMILPYPGGQYYVQCAVYNIADRANPVRERDFEIEGNYVSSRKIDNIVYLVTNKYVNMYYPVDDGGVVSPLLKDTATNGDYKAIPLTNICYFPNFKESNYASISSLDIRQPKQEAKVETFLGAGNNIYVSRDNMYIATSTYEDNESKTLVYKFSLNNGDITFLAKESVPGNIINQFSMDEYEGNFRIATTSYGTVDNVMSNNLYILDSAMQRRGSITGIAPNESIYSTRFVGNRGYMVTFQQVDPLFVLDLSDIDNPKILGKLKIPGYSNYLHPIDENHILGFGKDAEQYGSTAYYQGMKMALFDVTDVSNPKQEFEEKIGDRGTDSDLLYNHKALLYDPERNLLAFPVTVNTVKDNNGSATQYGEFEFNGAYVYNFSVDSGFQFKGKITHLTDEDYLKAGNYFDYQKKIDRILYANGNLFTTSSFGIQAHNADTLQLIKSIEIPQSK